MQLAFSGANRKERGGANVPCVFRLRVGGLPAQRLLAGTWGHRPGGPLWGQLQQLGQGPLKGNPREAVLSFLPFTEQQRHGHVKNAN